MSYNNHNNRNNNGFRNNNQHNNANPHFQIRLEQIKEMKKNEVKPTLQDYLNAIVNESKFDQNYENAEEVFLLLLEFFDVCLAMRPQKMYVDDEITIFQKSIATMIRYAPTPQKALDYTAYLLNEELPLRTEEVEATCLINLIFVYRVEGSPGSMSKALELIRLGLDRKIYNLTFKTVKSKQRDNIAAVFEQVANKVLLYHHLQFSNDKKSLEPLTQKLPRPHRYSTY